MNKRRRIKKILALLEKGEMEQARALVARAAGGGELTETEKAGYFADIAEFDPDNEDEDKALRSRYFSCYKGRRVIRLYSDLLTSAGVSRRTILLNYKSKPGVYGRAAVRHEYGHTVQAERMILPVFYTSVFFASPLYLVLTMLCGKNSWLSRNYYNMPWERSADMLGGVQPGTDRARAKNYAAWSDRLSRGYMKYHEFLSRLLTLGLRKNG